MSDDNGWTTVKKKPKKDKPTDGTVVRMRPPTISSRRLLKKSDYTLTDDEEQTLKDNNFDYFCTCCQNAEISRIIGRYLHTCYICYCCMGDDALGDNCNVYLNTNGIVSIIPKSLDDGDDEYY